MYYVRGRPHNAFFFQIVHRYLEAFPTTFDQALINCLLKKVGTTRRLSFLFSRDNCEADGINASHPALAPVLRMKGAWEYGALDPNHVLSHATPYVMRDTAAVHILTNKPLTASHGKKTVAKELMLWEGADCYYCVGGRERRYLALDEAVLNVMPPAFHMGERGHVMLLQARATRERAAAPSRAIAAARSRGIV